MSLPWQIAIFGDYNQESPFHFAANEALRHTAQLLSIPLEHK